MSSRAALLAWLLLAVGCTDPETAKQQHLDNGRRFATEKRFAEAILEFRNALQIDSKLAEAHLQLAEALAASGNPEAAYREYQRAADLMPDNAAVQKKAATFLFLAGQFEDVRTRVEGVLRKNPRDVEAQLLYANALVGLRDLEGGVREIEEAVQLDPGARRNLHQPGAAEARAGATTGRAGRLHEGRGIGSQIDPGPPGAGAFPHGHRQPAVGRGVARRSR